MSPYQRRKMQRAWATVAGLGILAVAGLQAYALTQGLNGSALAVSIAAISAIAGAGVGRALK